MVFRTIGARRVRSGRALLREIRESFYRKLSLAFVAASVVPVVALAFVTRVYIADRLRSDVESAAHKTTVIARQIIEDYRVQPRAELGDDALVGLSRVIGQDVNIFSGARLQATSERDLFASGLLPSRTPADVYRGIVLDRMPTVITEEQAAGFRYMVAAAPLRPTDRDAILTVPLTLRQQEIEREIDDLNRRLILAALLFILTGAAVGYPMAERIADPVNRLTRATRRIARGNLDARVATTSSDEFRRLVDAFNSMSAELLHQRQELERTHRLEAWAEMARQVAHDIKNPLTPIQLSAEHLRRVHADRGRPLDPVLDGCVDSILSQVRLLRQIASEFSSFAASPTARLAPVDLPDLVEEVIRPYEVGAGGRWRFAAAHRSPDPGVAGRSRAHRASADQHHRQCAPRHAGRRHDHGGNPASRGPVCRTDAGRHGGRHGRGGAGAPVRALLLHQGGGDRPRAVDRPAKRRAERRHHRGRQRARPGHAGDDHAAGRRGIGPDLAGRIYEGLSVAESVASAGCGRSPRAAEPRRRRRVQASPTKADIR